MPTDKDEKNALEAKRQASVSAEAAAAMERDNRYRQARQELFDDSVKSLAQSARQGGLRYASMLSKVVVLALVLFAVVSAVIALTSE